MGPHKNLKAWQESITLATKIYQVTAAFPKTVIFGIANQMRRCAVSIPSNIAEGYGRGSNNDLVHFLYISLGSSNELDTQLILSREMSFITEETFQDLSSRNSEVNKMISSLIYVRTHKMQQDECTEPQQTSKP